MIAVQNDLINYTSSERIRVWAADHPTARKTIQIALPILIFGSLAGAATLVGAPLWASAIVAIFIGTMLSSAVFLLMGPPETHMKLSDLASYCPHERFEYEDMISSFKRVALMLGPERFKAKLEAELPLERRPMSFYGIVGERLSKIGAGDDFFGPLPQFREFFLEQTQNLRCSEFMEKGRRDRGEAILFNKETIGYLVKSSVISQEEAGCLSRAYETTERYDQLERRAAKFMPRDRQNEDFQDLRHDIEQVVEQRLVQIRQERDAALGLIDAEYERIRVRV